MVVMIAVVVIVVVVIVVVVVVVVVVIVVVVGVDIVLLLRWCVVLSDGIGVIAAGVNFLTRPPLHSHLFLLYPPSSLLRTTPSLWFTT